MQLRPRSTLLAQRPLALQPLGGVTGRANGGGYCVRSRPVKKPSTGPKSCEKRKELDGYAPRSAYGIISMGRARRLANTHSCTQDALVSRSPRRRGGRHRPGFSATRSVGQVNSPATTDTRVVFAL